MTEKKKQSYRFGLWAENLAALYMMIKGYRILARRYKTQYGEIDLIGRRGKTILFIEVKARGCMNDALESLGKRSQKRIMKAAEYFLSTNTEYADHTIRFDFIAMAPPFYVRHLDNAWQTHT